MSAPPARAANTARPPPRRASSPRARSEVGGGYSPRSKYGLSTNAMVLITSDSRCYQAAAASRGTEEVQLLELELYTELLVKLKLTAAVPVEIPMENPDGESLMQLHAAIPLRRTPCCSCQLTRGGPRAAQLAAARGELGRRGWRRRRRGGPQNQRDAAAAARPALHAISLVVPTTESPPAEPKKR